MGILGFLFSRRRTGPAVRTADDWQAGDLAECLHDGYWYLGGQVPRLGPAVNERLVVASVVSAPGAQQFLVFPRYDKVHGYQASGFRKIVPQPDQAIAGTATTIEQLRPAPARQPARAPS